MELEMESCNNEDIDECQNIINSNASHSSRLSQLLEYIRE